MGLLFNKIIPMEMLARMPRSFVHRLRDLRIKQLEAQRNGGNNIPPQTPIPNPAFDNTAIEDLIDELS